MLVASEANVLKTWMIAIVIILQSQLIFFDKLSVNSDTFLCHLRKYRSFVRKKTEKSFMVNIT